MWCRFADVITCANFFENRQQGFEATGLPKMAFPTLSIYCPYNSVSTTMLHCENENCQIA